MNILTDTSDQSVSSLRFTLGLILLIVFGYSVGAILAQLILHLDPDQSSFVLDRGPGKLMRRITMIVVLGFLPLLLRRTSWKGWPDNGLSYRGPRSVPVSREYGVGFIIGLLTLLALMGIAFLRGDRYWDPDYGFIVMIGVLVGYTFRALAVGIGEELVVRGIFFRSIERMWRVWPTAIITSLIFSLGHFMKPQDHAFGGSFGIGWILDPMHSMVVYMINLPLIEWRVVNMTLMSIVLCMVVYRRKTIWLAAGMHSGWILAKAINGKVFSKDHELGIGWWTGARSDFTDSALCLLMLLSLLIITLLMKPRSGYSPGDIPDNEKQMKVTYS